MATNFKKQLYANNATSTLAYSIDSTSEVISLADASRFPQPSSTEYFCLTIGTGVNSEIVEVHGRDGNTLTGCIRGAQGTTATGYGAGTLAENRLTADSISQLSRDQDKLAQVESLQLLGKPELFNNNSCLLQDTDDAGNPIVAFEYSGRWRFSTHPITQVDQEVFDTTTQITPTSLQYTSSTDLSEAFVAKGLIIQAVTGENRGIARYVHSATITAISWVSPFPYPFAYGDRVQVYQSASSAIAWLNFQISSVAGGQSTQQSLIQEEIYKTAYKAPVAAATTANISLSGLQTVDGFSLQVGDRVLVKNQASPSQNGIYVAAVAGWTRAPDANDNVKVRPNMMVPVANGTVNADSVWFLDVPATVTLGTTGLPFKNLNFKYATLESPALTGTPTAPTAAANTNTTQVATTAFVAGQAASNVPSMDGMPAVGSSLKFAREDHVHPSDSTRATVDSPSFTNTPTAPTPPQFSNSTRLATTEFVQRALGNFASLAFRTAATEVISASDMGKVLIFTNAVSVYLPKIADVPNGSSITIRSESSSCFAIYPSTETNGDWVSLDQRYTAGGPLYIRLYLMPGESITLTLYRTGQSGGYPTLSARWFATAGDIVGQPPTGSVMYFATQYAPFGYVPADGIERSRTQYARLFNVIGTYWGAGNGSTTFKIPEIRGEFIRAWDYGRGVDANRMFGSYQLDQFASHNHYTNWQLSNEGGSVSNSIGSGSTNLEPVYFTLPTQSTGGNETRPRNIALLACIKY